MIESKKSDARRNTTKRINRRLAADDQHLVATRGERWRADLGDYYIVDLHTGNVEAQHVDIDELASELAV